MISTGLISKSLARPEQVIFTIMAGKELGMGPMWAVQNLQIVDGKVSAKAEAMMALVFKNCPGAQIDFIQNDAAACRLEASRPGCKPQPFGFSMDDAKLARLDGKDNWKKYPRAMLRSRAVSEMCRALFPEAIAGISSYTPEEIEDMRKEPNIKIEPERVTIQSESYTGGGHPSQAQLPALSLRQYANDNNVISKDPHGPVEPPKSLRQILREEFELSETDLCEFLGVKTEDLGPQHSKALQDLYRDLKAGALSKQDVLSLSIDPIEEVKND